MSLGSTVHIISVNELSKATALEINKLEVALLV